MKKNTVPILMTSIVFFQNPIWPIWGINAYLSFLSILLLLFLCKGKNRIMSSGCRVTFFVLLMYFCGFHFHFGVQLGYLFHIMAFFCVCTTTPEERRVILEYVSKIFGIVLGVSLVAWVLHTLSIVNFPMINILDNSSFKGNESFYYNYGFFVQGFGSSSFRFYSMFDEPGVVGTLGAFLMFANKYDFRKWYNIVIFFSCLLSFSLVSYILTFIGLTYFVITHRKSVKIAFPLVVILIVLALMEGGKFIVENEGFQISIVSRIEDGTGNSLEKRTSQDVDKASMKLFDSTDFLTGLGHNEYQRRHLQQGQSWNLFLLEYGVLGILFLIIAYLSLIKKWNRDIACFFFIFWLSFLQRPFALYAWQMIIFASAVSSLSIDGFVKKNCERRKRFD